MSIEDIKPRTQKHDGVTFKFDAKKAHYDETLDLWYMDPRDSSMFVCQRHSRAHQLGADGQDVAGYYDFDYNLNKSGKKHLDYAPEYIAKKEHHSACFICGVIRHKKGCFPPGVKISTGPNSHKPVEDIAVGDMLWNPLLKKPVKVLRVLEGPEELPLMELAYDGGSLVVTQEHPILTTEGTKPARDLQLTDKVYDGSGAERMLTGLKLLAVNEGQTVINFVLEAEPTAEDEARMVLADGIVTGDFTLQQELSGN